MTAFRVVLWRHGQTDMNLTGRIQGARDFPLNDKGVDQARAAAKIIAGLEPSLIVSSPLARAFQTASELSALIGVDVETDDRFKERSFGLFEGMTGAEIEERYPEQYRRWKQAKEPEGVGVERQVDVGLRAGRAVEEWACRTDGTLVVASHGAAIKCAVTALVGEIPGGWMGLKVMSNCHWAILEPLRFGPPAWRIAAYNLGAGDIDDVRTPTQ